MYVYTLVELRSNLIGFLIVKLRPLDYSTVFCIKRALQIGIGLCVLHTLEIFSGAVRRKKKETIAVGKQGTAIYLKRWRRRWRKPVNVVIPYRNCIPGCGSAQTFVSSAIYLVALIIEELCTTCCSP